ncbi:unnamed protein product [Chrysoparadoxa australica]
MSFKDPEGAQALMRQDPAQFIYSVGQKLNDLMPFDTICTYEELPIDKAITLEQGIRGRIPQKLGYPPGRADFCPPTPDTFSILLEPGLQVNLHRVPEECLDSVLQSYMPRVLDVHSDMCRTMWSAVASSLLSREITLSSSAQYLLLQRLQSPGFQSSLKADAAPAVLKRLVPFLQTAVYQIVVPDNQGRYPDDDGYSGCQQELLYQAAGAGHHQQQQQQGQGPEKGSGMAEIQRKSSRKGSSQAIGPASGQDLPRGTGSEEKAG